MGSGDVYKRQLLIRAYEQMRELASGSASLCEQFWDCGLQELPREQKRGLERHPRSAPGTWRCLHRRNFGVLVEKPRRVALEHFRDQQEHVLGGNALPALDHAQIRHRRSRLRVDLDAAHRQLLERHVVLLAQGAQLCAQKMTLPGYACHDDPREMAAVKACPSMVVKFTL